MFKFIKRLFCKHENKKEIYCDIEDWADLHYLYICENCGKEWYK